MRVYVKTYGCTLNQADSQLMSNVLSNDGIEICNDSASADVVVVNTCTVKSPTEQKILSYLGGMEKAQKPVVVTGCMAGANRDLIEKRAPSASILTPSNIGSIAEAARSAFVGERTVTDRYNRSDKLAFFAHSGGVIAQVPINDGCLSSCGFCETKLARGPLNSFPEEKILNAIEYSARSGAKEIQLASQDEGAYGADRGTNIAKLMEKVSMIDGDFLVRVGMLNPEHLHKYVEEFVAALQKERFYKFVHLPIQSGSNKVLSEMKRRYTVEKFAEYTDRIRSAVPGVTIETDVIVGYPTETEADFEQTLDFVRNIKPDVVNMSKFSIRPNTEAAKLRQLQSRIIARRSGDLGRVVRHVQKRLNERLIGKTFRTIVTEEDDRSMNGRNSFYKKIILKKADGIMLGSTLSARIYAVSCNVAYGEPVA